MVISEGGVVACGARHVGALTRCLSFCLGWVGAALAWSLDGPVQVLGDRAAPNTKGMHVEPREPCLSSIRGRLHLQSGMDASIDIGADAGAGMRKGCAATARRRRCCCCWCVRSAVVQGGSATCQSVMDRNGRRYARGRRLCTHTIEDPVPPCPWSRREGNGRDCVAAVMQSPCPPAPGEERAGGVRRA